MGDKYSNNREVTYIPERYFENMSRLTGMETRVFMGVCRLQQDSRMPLPTVRNLTAWINGTVLPAHGSEGDVTLALDRLHELDLVWHDSRDNTWRIWVYDRKGDAS